MYARISVPAFSSLWTIKELFEQRERVAKGMTENVGGDGTVKKRPTKVVKVGRNDLCPCGSGLKWKKCTCKEYHS